MSKGVVARVESLGMVLVASTDTVLAAAVGRMVSQSGFTPAFPTGFEGPWLSVTRTQPHVVICDWDAPVARLQRLIVETAARRVPLVIVHRTEPSPVLPTLASVERVTWIKFPVSAATFGRVLADLMPPTRHAA